MMDDGGEIAEVDFLDSVVWITLRPGGFMYMLKNGGRGAILLLLGVYFPFFDAFCFGYLAICFYFITFAT